MLIERLPQETDLGLNDPARVCPIFAGPSLIEGDHIAVKLPQAELSIDAPGRLLRKAFELCDGTRTIIDILATFRVDAQRKQFESFLNFLFESGALIESSFLVANAARYGWVTNAYGQAAEPELTANISNRFLAREAPDPGLESYKVDAPLRDFFEDRISSHIYHPGRKVSLESINTLLWSLHGIVRANHEHLHDGFPRRTIASAGALHLLEIYVVLRHEMQGPGGRSLKAGAYRVIYPDAHRIDYELISHDIRLFPRVLAKPWYLTSACGAVFLAANERLAGLKYRNRSVQYLYMEAGAALQNGALTAAKIGMGFTPFGSFSEAYAQQLLQRPDRFMLGSAIFGAAADQEQYERAACCEKLEFAWADAPSEIYQLPYFVARVRSKNDPSNKPTWGRDTDPALACRKAIAEHIERRGYAEPRDLVLGAISEMPGPVEPQAIARFSKEQYRNKQFSLEPFNPDRQAWWAQGINTTNGKATQVLAEFVYSSEPLKPYFLHRKPCWRSNSSGCAAGGNAESAREAALLELIERDAFMRQWLVQRPGIGLELASLPQELSVRISAIRATGFEVQLQWLPNDCAQVAFLMARHPERRFLCVAAGARQTMDMAVHSALVELESRVFSLLHDHAVPHLTPRTVRTPDDHFGLYSFPANYHRADGIAMPKTFVTFGEVAKRDTQRKTLDRILLAGLTPLVFDITPKLNGIDGGNERLVVYRAIVPGLIPMSFGYGLEPRGMLDDVHPGSHFPHPFP